jgi:6-phospho-beta-glucosidase
MLGQETNGVGGFAKALRTIPVILDIARDMERLCPDAFLINFTNPASIITETVQRFTKIKAIGLCNVPVNMRKAVEKVLDSDDFLFHAIGLNHYVFGHSVYFKGKNVMPEILPKLMADTDFNPKNIEDIPYHDEQILNLGMMPCYYHKYFYMADDMLHHAIEDYKTTGTRGEVVKRVEKELFDVYKRADLSEKPVELEKRGGSYYSEAACELINGIYNNKKNYMIVNVKNNQTLPFLPEDAVIETTCLITDAGPKPLSIEALPIQVQGELHLLKAYERLTIDASISGDYGTALQALTIHPLTKKGAVLKTVLDEVLEQNKDYLPQFK